MGILSTLFGKNITDLSNDIVIGYKFYVFVGAVSLAFNKISGIEEKTNYQTVQEGGVNNKLTFLTAPIDQPSTLVLEDGGLIISLVSMKLCFGSGPKDVIILLCNPGGSINNVLMIKDAVVSRVSISDLSADESKVVVNSIEMSYTGFTRIAFNLF